MFFVLFLTKHSISWGSVQVRILPTSQSLCPYLYLKSTILILMLLLLLLFIISHHCSFISWTRLCFCSFWRRLLIARSALVKRSLLGICRWPTVVRLTVRVQIMSSSIFNYVWQGSYFPPSVQSAPGPQFHSASPSVQQVNSQPTNPSCHHVHSSGKHSNV